MGPPGVYKCFYCLEIEFRKVLPTRVNVGVDVLKYSLSQAYSFVMDILPILSSITVSSSLIISVQT